MKTAYETFETYAALKATGLNWENWNKPSHPGYSSAGRAVAAMSRDSYGWQSGVRLAAYFDAPTKRWVAVYTADDRPLVAGKAVPNARA